MAATDTDSDELLLSACLGAPVVASGRRVGRLRDVTVVPGAPSPTASGVVVARRGAPERWAPWSAVTALAPAGVTVDGGALGPVPAGVRLARDVLDAQLIDLAGRRVVRVGDVDLRVARAGGAAPVIAGVELGLDSVLRRLGLPRLARRLDPVRAPWSQLHLPSHPGAELTIAAALPVLRRMPAGDRRRLSARLPARAAARLWPGHGHPRPRFPTHVLRRHRAPR